RHVRQDAARVLTLSFRHKVEVLIGAVQSLPVPRSSEYIPGFQARPPAGGTSVGTVACLQIVVASRSAGPPTSPVARRRSSRATDSCYPGASVSKTVTAASRHSITATSRIEAGFLRLGQSL